MDNLITALLAWLRAPQAESAQAPPEATKENEMTDVLNTTTINTDPDAFLPKLKALLTTLGHDVDLVWDEAVALAKKAA